MEHLAIPLVDGLFSIGMLVADDLWFQLLDRPSHNVTGRLSGNRIFVSDILNTGRVSIFRYVAFIHVLNTRRRRVFIGNKSPGVALSA